MLMFQDQRGNFRWTMPHFFLPLHNSACSKLLVFGSCFVALVTSSDISHFMSRSKQKAEPRPTCSTVLLHFLYPNLPFNHFTNPPQTASLAAPSDFRFQRLYKGTNGQTKNV